MNKRVLRVDTYEYLPISINYKLVRNNIQLVEKLSGNYRFATVKLNFEFTTVARLLIPDKY